MSRIGKKPISVPGNVKVAVQGNLVTIEGPLGKLSYAHRPEVAVAYDAGTKTITVTRNEETRQGRAFHGLARALIANMIVGVTAGYRKTLEIYGTGYGVKQEGTEIALALGFANAIKFPLPPGVKLEIKTPQSRSETNPAIFTLSGADKQVVGELAARIKRAKIPEPYKGKGIRFQGEHIRRKAGKAFGATK